MKKIISVILILFLLCGCSANGNEYNPNEPQVEEKQSLFVLESEISDAGETGEKIGNELNLKLPSDPDSEYSYVYTVTGSAQVEKRTLYFGTCYFYQLNSESNEKSELFNFVVDKDVAEMFETYSEDGKLTWGEEINLLQ